MGIFDKKTKGRRSEDFDSPMEQVDLNAAAKSSESGEEEVEAKTADVAKAASPPEKAAEKPVESGSRKAAKKVDQDYGIEEAIALMRTLPADSIELVVRVVKQTLESTHIDIPTIILDATAKQERITNRIGVLKEEITNLEKEIAARSSEIGNLETDHEETSMVKERLELAEKLGQKEQASGSKNPAPGNKPASSVAAKK